MTLKMKLLFGAVFSFAMYAIIYTFIRDMSEPVQVRGFDELLSPPHNQNAVLLCDGAPPLFVDKWHLKQGRFVFRIGNVYGVSAFNCALISGYPDGAETKEARR
jgi:hypothetical protein